MRDQIFPARVKVEQTGHLAGLVDSFLSPLRGRSHSGVCAQGLRPFGRPGAGCGLYSFAALRLGYAVMLAVALVATPMALAQSGQSQNQNPPAANSQSSQDIPDAPSTVQPPPPKPAPEAESKPAGQDSEPARPSSETGGSANSGGQPSDQPKQPPPMPPVETVPAGSVPEGDQTAGPKNQINPSEPLYKLRVTTSFVQIPVMVRDGRGTPVYGLTYKDFTVNENGKPQTLSYFTSDPFPLSVAIVLDIGMADVAFQKVNQTYSSLVGAFSPYDEVSLYTYSSTVSQVSDFTNHTERLTASLDEMKLVRGRNNGPPVLGGPLGPQPPMVNGIPVGSAGPPPVYTPPKEAHVLNDAILRAALDLSKRPRGLRKVIFVISDGREYGSRASYSDVLKLLETRDIQVRGVVVDQGALPIYKQIEKLHLKGQGYSNILPKYVYATCGGQVYSELSRNGMEDAYTAIASEARNQYTLGYAPKAAADSSAYRSIEVLVHRKDVKVSAKDGYYRIPAAR